MRTGPLYDLVFAIEVIDLVSQNMRSGVAGSWGMEIVGLGDGQIRLDGQQELVSGAI